MKRTNDREACGYRVRPCGVVILATSVILQCAVSSMAEPGPGMPDVLSGRVLNVAGKPIGGATVYVTSDPTLQKITDNRGRFHFTAAETKGLLAKAEADKPIGGVDVVAIADGFGLDWVELRRWGTPSEMDLDAGAARSITLRLVNDDAPIRGQLVDRENRPVPGVCIELGYVLAMPDEDLSPFLAAWEGSKRKRWSQLDDLARKRYVPLRRRFPRKDGARLSEPALAATVISDDQGRFEIHGVGRERAVWLDLKHPDFVQQRIFTGTRDKVKLLPAEATLPPFHPATFVQVLERAKPFCGTVRECGTGEPIAGATVYVQMNPPKNTGVAKANSGEDGTFQVGGLGEAESYRCVIVPAEGQHHLRRIVSVPGTAGLEPIHVDVELHRGVVVTGRITNKVTGQPIHRATLGYISVPGNPHCDEMRAAGDEAWDHRFVTDQDGGFAVTVPPGVGLIGVRAWCGCGGADQFRACTEHDFPYPLETGKDLRSAFGGMVRPEQYHAVVRVDLSEDGGSDVLDIQLNPAKRE